ncbi:DNA polymerase III subunit beta [Streptacidiphilus fuscans]|uniref:Beta sliding clamp n=1 Tax=Streptacidiphilus fuscans TaxID=2789292 RepID=A0A931FEC0_9ACTN|nr:DNA polymerase III subunit beta [Streptacidiphilus fuscans]MBF9070488.1 DNA polymerase III subunit beta [Streptacidiphilus fuscans]
MKFRLSREALTEAVSWAAHALPARSTVPALSGLLLTAEQRGHDGVLTVSGFDFEVSARFESQAEVFESGAARVPGRLLADLAKALPVGHDVELATAGSDALLTCGPAQFELPLLPPEDGPRLPELPPALGSVDGALFAEAVAQVAVVAGRDEALPFLTGIRLELHADMLRLVATDRYRLAVREIPWHRSAVPAGAVSDAPSVALVPARTLHEITRSLTKDEQIRISPSTEETNGSGGLIGFAAGSREATTRLLASDFIRYEAIFPSAFSGSALIERRPLLDAVKRVALVTERHRPLRLSFEPGRLVVDAGGGSEARGRQTLDAHFDAEPVVLSANAGYLLDGLGALTSRYAELSYTTPTKPAVLTGREDDARPGEDTAAQDAPSYRYLFMPLRVG